MTQPRLMPCPFCGKEEIKTVREGQAYKVACSSCSATVTGTTPMDAELRWNRRDPEPVNKVLLGKIRRLEQMLSDGPRRVSQEMIRTARLNSNRSK